MAIFWPSIDWFLIRDHIWNSLEKNLYMICVKSISIKNWRCQELAGGATRPTQLTATATMGIWCLPFRLHVGRLDPERSCNNRRSCQGGWGWPWGSPTYEGSPAVRCSTAAMMGIWRVCTVVLWLRSAGNCPQLWCPCHVVCGGQNCTPMVGCSPYACTIRGSFEILQKNISQINDA